jgi:glycosyltransferase involved in cell wall biosynthesis
MRILFVADGRSPITKNWIKYFAKSDAEVHLVSTYPCVFPFDLASINIVPVALSSLAKESSAQVVKEPSESARLSSRALLRRIIPVSTRTWIRQWLGPYTLPRSAGRLSNLIRSIKPDFIHAMRIPFEGMLTTIALRELPEIPLMVSVWGNDFTLHAHASRLMSDYTRQVMERADALHTDTHRDQLLAREWGYKEQNQVIVLPCAGGVDMGIFYPAPHLNDRDVITIINPRGFRAYVRNDTFFRSIPLIIKEKQNIRFICPAMESETQAVKWLGSLDISSYVRLLPLQSPEEMANLFRQAQIITSITTHDGSPNSLLEAMASGCFPIVGDIDSLREWITQDVNGILIDPVDPRQLAEAVLKAVGDVNMRAAARQINVRMIEERAEYQKGMAEVYNFYKSIVLGLSAVDDKRLR